MNDNLIQNEKVISKRKKKNTGEQISNDIHWTDFEKRLKPKQDKDYQKLADEILEYAKRETSVVFGSFAHEKLMCESDLIYLGDRHEGLRRAIDLALEMIGNRRQIRGLENRYNAKLVEVTMPLYDKRFKQLREQERNKQEQNETKIVIIEKTPNSDLVPMRNAKHVADQKESND